MAELARSLLTNFSKGELSPLLEGRPDLAAYFEGGRIIENFLLLRQGGLRRRPGTRFIAEAKFFDNRALLIPFESSTDETYTLEVGQQYMRFYKDGVQLQTSPGVPFEIVTPWLITDLAELHYTQSVDVMFFFHPDHAQQKLIRLGDLNWTIAPVQYNPPPSFEFDAEISNGNTLTPGATSGTGVTFTASGVVFLDADIGRVIVFGASRATIISIGGGGTTATADITEPFPNTNPIPSGQWFLHLSPQTTLDPNIKGPVGAQVTLQTGVAAFRPSDVVDRFIFIYGGLVELNQFVNTNEVKGKIVSEMVDAEDADPPAAPAGAWALETASWGLPFGAFPRTGEFFQGRLGQAGSRTEPNVFWLSRSDDFENYATGDSAEDALTYAVATKQLNRIVWMADNKDLFLGTSGSIHRVSSGNSDDVIGGDQIPLVRRISSPGSAPLQPVSIGSRIVFIDRSLAKIYSIIFNLEEDNYDAVELTGVAEHITQSLLKLKPIAYMRNPDPRIYVVRNDGQLVTLTYNYQEKVIGFTRLTTQSDDPGADGMFGSVAITARSGKSDRVMMMVDRVINGVGKTYIETFEDDAPEMAGRLWTELHTDCAKLYDLNGIETAGGVAGLAHLEGKMVQVIADGVVQPLRQVIGGNVIVEPSAFETVEVGLPYTSTVRTMRPAVEGQVTEGRARAWRNVWARLHQSIGGKINDQILLSQAPSFVQALFTGDVDTRLEETFTLDGYLTFVQDQPYPMTLLALFGEIIFADYS